MPDRPITQTTAAPGRRRRPPRPLDLFGLTPEERMAAGVDAQQTVESLMDDVFALVDAGLIAPLHEDGAVRYAPNDANNPDFT